ncbi:unnamed protein product [Paramecium octaurelia]|uniref:Protein translocase subunit SecA n=1 Tax=Paramecium octaurelia TaxID=43137 RepID=A0A8S1WM64_PAROT|nr:unnamed protein product [Paramecium octaurelia]
MLQSISNSNWSTNDNKIIQILTIQLGLTQIQTSILLPQLQKIKSAEKVVDCFMKQNKDLKELQENIQNEITHQMTVQKQCKRQKGQWNQYELIRLKNKLSQSIKNIEESNCLFQYIQQHYDQEIINQILCYEFKTIKEFFQQIQKMGAKISRINNYIQSNENKQIKNNFGNSCLVNKQIQDLFKEFYSLNNRNNHQVEKQLIQLYNSLENQQQDQQIYDFKMSPQLEYEELLNLCNLVKQHFSYYPRPVQLLSVIELYNHNDKLGRLSEIYTGEGKTLIVAMLAILLCKKKKVNVDIVTSSPVLAIRDAKELTSFYELFSISVAHNINEPNTTQNEGMLPCYKSQVIYGDPHSFQSDILRHQYQGINIKKKEQWVTENKDILLLMNNKTLLCTPIPGMLDLTKVLRLIWDEISKVEPNISTENKVMIIDGDNNYYSMDLVEYVEQTLDKQIKDALENQIPNFRLDYINYMKKRWIENAIQAKFHYHEKQHYLIDNNKVRIIDFQNTGVVQKENTQWQKGLHQFIQFKHNLSISTLRISTNFMSNVGFFKRYKNQLLGLTGTLGSQVTQNLLANKYNIDFVFIPPYKKRILQEEPGIVVFGEDEWFEEIYKAVSYQINRKRAVLIINKTINDVEKIEAYLQNFNLKSITYVDNNQEIQKEIGPNIIIIATNLAGRGTDLTTNEELETNGGLHVIMSFLPRNLRIQLQGFGRTGRQGKQGTAQLIVNCLPNLYVGLLNEITSFDDAIGYFKQNTKKENYTPLDVLVYFRDLHEQQYSDEIEQEMDKLENEDKCFQKFYQIAKSKVNIKTDRPAFLALEEKWGLYLEQFQESGLKEEEIEKYLNSKEWQNPKQLIYQGIQHKDLKLLKQAAEISEHDPIVKYYQGLFEIQEKDYDSGKQSLEQAKALLQIKMDDDEGFATAAKLNRIQVDQFKEQEQINNQQQSDIENKIQPQKMANLNLRNNSLVKKGSAIQFKEQINSKKDLYEQKIQNQLKVYQKAKDNIDELLNTLSNFQKDKEELNLSWVPVIEKEEKENAESEQCIKDQEEVIQDGPLPRLGKLTKQKKNSWGQYIAMFALGLGQFIVGCGICAFTRGAAMPIGKGLIKEGFSDMIYSVTAAWQGIDIDWKAWGKQKSIQVATALALAGPAGISEALQLGSSMKKSLKKIGFLEFLKSIPNVTFEGLKRSGYWLPEKDQEKVQQQCDVLKQVSEKTQQANNENQILNLVKEVLENQVQIGVISNEKASEISKLVNDCLYESEGDVKKFNNSFIQIALKFIKLQMAKTQSEKTPTQIKSDLIEVCGREATKKYDKIKNDIHNYNQYKQALNNELTQFPKIIFCNFSKDQQIQKKMGLLDLHYEFHCDSQQVEKLITNGMIQTNICQNFSIFNKDFQKACNQLQISNPQSVSQFYQEVIRPFILKLLINLIQEDSEPLEWLFHLELQKSIQQKNLQGKIEIEKLEKQSKTIQYRQNQINKPTYNQTYYQNQGNQIIDEQSAPRQFHFQQAQWFQEIKNCNCQQISKEIIGYMKMKRMINDDGISFSPNFQQEFYQYLSKSKFNTMMREVVEQSMKNSLRQISTLKSNSKKLFSTKLLKAIEIEIIDVIKSYIFNQRMEIENKKLANKMD